MIGILQNYEIMFSYTLAADSHLQVVCSINSRRKYIEDSCQIVLLDMVFAVIVFLTYYQYII